MSESRRESPLKGPDVTSLTDYIAQLDPERGLLIGGEWRSGGNGTFTVERPADAQALAQVADASPEDAVAAVDAASRAFASWQHVAPRERAELLRRTWELMIRDTEELAALMAAENGKSLADARGEVAYAAEFFRWFSEEAVRTAGDYGPAPAGGTRTIVTQRPVGVSILVTPWNFPAAMASRKIAPALAAGCTVVLKPAGETPLTALAVGRLLLEAGVPEGVVNVLPSSNSGETVTALLEDPRTRMISFTGSTRVGSILLKQAADRILNTGMELGGNAPFVITEDADIDAAVEGAMMAKFRNAGQACTAANRFHLHESVAEEFIAKFGERLAQLTVGPAESGAAIGPLISAKAVAGLSEVVDAAVAAGATIARQATLPTGLTGHFYPPTLLVDVSPQADILSHELFGPVAPVVTFSTDEEAVAQANATEMGLSSYVYAGDLGRALHLAERIDAGMVGINRGIVSDPAAPFGGTKQSGIGREGARVGLDEFTETQYFSVAW